MGVLKIENLVHYYKDGTLALDGITLSIPKGKKTVFMGPNGAGKSTLLLHFNGVFLAQKGRVLLENQVIGKDNIFWAREKVGLVFQDPDDQLFCNTVWEDVAFGPRNFGYKENEVEEIVNKSMEKVGIMDLKDKNPYNLSYGQKKKAAIAGVLAMEPEVIVLDEPTAFLDFQSQNTLEMLINDLNIKGVTIVMVTHDIDFAAEWADHLILIKEGKKVAQGTPNLLINQSLMQEMGMGLPRISRLFQNILPSDKILLPKNISEGINVLNKKRFFDE